jgi:hypothetical protein
LIYTHVPANREDDVRNKDYRFSPINIAELAVLTELQCQLLLDNRRGNIPTKVCVDAPARAKLMTSQLELPMSLNSDAMTGCVARSSEPSAFETKIPMRSTTMMCAISARERSGLFEPDSAASCSAGVRSSCPFAVLISVDDALSDELLSEDIEVARAIKGVLSVGALVASDSGLAIIAFAV